MLRLSFGRLLIGLAIHNAAWACGGPIHCGYAMMPLIHPRGSAGWCGKTVRTRILRWSRLLSGLPGATVNAHAGSTNQRFIGRRISSGAPVIASAFVFGWPNHRRDHHYHGQKRPRRSQPHLQAEVEEVGRRSAVSFGKVHGAPLTSMPKIIWMTWRNPGSIFAAANCDRCVNWLRHRDDRGG